MWARIDAGDFAGRANEPCRATSHDSGAAPHIEQTLALANGRELEELPSPRPEQRGNHELFVRFGRIRHRFDLPRSASRQLRSDHRTARARASTIAATTRRTIARSSLSR